MEHSNSAILRGYYIPQMVGYSEIARWGDDKIVLADYIQM